MTRRRAGVLVVAGLIAWVGRADGRRAAVPPQTDARTRLASTVAPVIDTLWSRYDMTAAMSHVQFIGQYWRLPGNPGYNASIDHVRDRLVAAGLKPVVEEYPNSGPAWDHTVGTLAIATPGRPDEVVISREKDHIALCINSFSTAPGGVVAPLVDVGSGTAEDFAGKDLKGAVVLGDAAPVQLWTRALPMGAIGVVSASPPPRYINPDAPGAPVTPRDQWDIFQWTSVPYDAARKAFGFKASARAAGQLRKRIAAAGSSPVSVHVTIESSFSTGPVRTLVVEIPGRTAPAERIVLAAHVQEPGANDNASGVATLTEAAVSLAAAIRDGKVAPPERTLTFLFLTEISGSRRWLQDHAEAAKQVRYMFSLDMTGEDVKKTGGSFLIERYPDPGAVYDRPWDPHTEWGRGNVRADSLKGDLLNDTHLFVVQQVAQKTGWVVHTNPYEGGSDHTVFQGAGVPSVLDWHFTDRYYHSNFDTPDKTSPEEMRNVGVAVGASAWLLASATPAIATDVADVVAAAGHARVNLEMTEGAKIAAAAADPAAAASRETTIVAAWKKWYAEAVRSAARLVFGAPPATFAAGIERIAATFESGGIGGSGSTRFVAAADALVGLAASPGQDVQAKQDRTPIFVCGTDQQIPAIPLTWNTVVLAGDGRLYTPCPSGDHGSDHREVREKALIGNGLQSSDPTVRWRAAQAFARNSTDLQLVVAAGATSPTAPAPQSVALAVVDGLGGWTKGSSVRAACNAEVQVFNGTTDPQRWQPGRLFFMLRDSEPPLARGVAQPAPAEGSAAVRKEAAYAIGVRLSRPGLDPNLVVAATKELRMCLTAPEVRSDPELAGLILEALGLARYASDDQVADAEAFLVQEGRSPEVPKILGAVKGLEALLRQNPRHQIGDSARFRLRQLVTYGARATEPLPLDPDPRIRRLALLALQAARDQDAMTLREAVTDTDWQVHRIVAASLNLSDPEQWRLAEQLQNDTAFQVRYDLLSPLARLATRTGQCAPIVARFKDQSPIVVMHAMDVLVASCTDLDEALTMLVRFADDLGDPEKVKNWHVPSRALAALARIKPDDAKPRLAAAVKHPAWQVRAAAAATSVTLADAEAANTLAQDPEPNVRTAALDALFRMKSADVVPRAIDALKTGADYQLLRMAALVLKGLPDDAKDEASDALLIALRKLTAQETDTSRDPRVAILERLGEALSPVRSSDLLPFVGDYDDQVNAAVSKSFASLVNTPPAQGAARRRYPFQPPADALSALPSQASIFLDEGTVTLRLLTDVAPVTVARFTALVAQGFYNDRTFHRVVPNFVVQGGSPGANEYSGTSRYMRDEVGPQAVHVRGAVGISTRGGDTGDGQIFIDLVDLPRLDRDYTVFAYVTAGMELVDRLLEGAKIISISVK